MPEVTFIISMSVFFLVILLIIIFWYPVDKKVKKRKRKLVQEKPQKDWQAIGLRLEKQALFLRNEIANLQKKQMVRDKELEQLKGKNIKLQEKLSNEKKWREKEQNFIDKENLNTRRIKEDFLKAERNLAEAHSLKLRLEREVMELKQEVKEVNGQKKELSAEFRALDANFKSCQKELIEQKKINTELSRKTNETKWIARAEYDKVQRLLKIKEKEMARFLREQDPKKAVD